jgi:hypothetical protein
VQAKEDGDKLQFKMSVSVRDEISTSRTGNIAYVHRIDSRVNFFIIAMISPVFTPIHFSQEMHSSK